MSMLAQKPGGKERYLHGNENQFLEEKSHPKIDSVWWTDGTTKVGCNGS